MASGKGFPALKENLVRSVLPSLPTPQLLVFEYGCMKQLSYSYSMTNLRTNVNMLSKPEVLELLNKPWDHSGFMK